MGNENTTIPAVKPEHASLAIARSEAFPPAFPDFPLQPHSSLTLGVSFASGKPVEISDFKTLGAMGVLR